MTLVAPSLLSADFLHLQRDVDFVNANADLFHMDVMDGVMVPNISFGFPIIKAVSKTARKPMDVHFMISKPETYVPLCFDIPNVGMISFHLEACPQPDSLLDSIRAHGIKAGLAINPDFPLEKLYPHLEHCDFVLIMSVFAGFGGQKFIQESHSRIRQLKQEILSRNLDVMIEVDGGVNLENAGLVSASGADILVAGTAVFKAENPAEAVRIIRG